MPDIRKLAALLAESQKLGADTGALRQALTAVRNEASPEGFPAPPTGPNSPFGAGPDDFSGEDSSTSERDSRRSAGPVPAPNLPPMWIDPEEMPFAPQPRPGNAGASRFFSLSMLALFLAGLAWLIVPEVNFRYQSQGQVFYNDGILTAQGVPIAPISPSIVTEVFFDADSLPTSVVPAGTPIATVRSVSPTGQGVRVSTLTVPFEARFVSIDTLVGAIAEPGHPVATLYDPDALYVIVTIRQTDLDLLRRGMTVKLSSDLIDGHLDGRVVSAVPLLGTEHEPTANDLVNVRIKPDSAEVKNLLPGIRFDISIDTQSVGTEAPLLVYSHPEPAESSSQPSEPSGT